LGRQGVSLAKADVRNEAKQKLFAAEAVSVRIVLQRHEQLFGQLFIVLTEVLLAEAIA